MHLCYVDESGCTGELPSTTSPIQPLFAIVGLILDQSRVHDLTLKFLYLKRQYFPRAVLGTGRPPQNFLDWILFEPKGGELRKQAAEPSKRVSRHALRFFDETLKLVEEAGGKLVGRVWVKGIGQPFDGRSVYTSAVQHLCGYFDHYLQQQDDHGFLIADSRTKNKNAKVSHSVFTQRFSSKGNPYSRLLELPVFGHSDNHAGLQVDDSPCPNSHARYAPAPVPEDPSMSLRVRAVAIVTAIALCGPALAQPAKPEAAVHKLRNIAAADAAHAVTAFVEKKNLPVTVVAEPRSNSVMLAGDAAPIRQVVELLASLDKEPPLVVAQILALEAPAGFAEDTGLGEGEANWVLTPREVRMLTAAIRSGQARLEVDVLSRPQLIVADNTTGVVQIGGTEADSLTACIAPRIGSDGTVLLRVETQVKRTSKGMAEAETVQATGKIADGGTLVTRGARTKTAGGATRETLVIVTIHLVASERK